MEFVGRSTLDDCLENTNAVYILFEILAAGMELEVFYGRQVFG